MVVVRYAYCVCASVRVWWRTCVYGRDVFLLECIVGVVRCVQYVCMYAYVYCSASVRLCCGYVEVLVLCFIRDVVTCVGFVKLYSA